MLGSGQTIKEASANLNLDIVSGNCPDIVNLQYGSLGSFASKGVLEDLTRFLEESELEKYREIRTLLQNLEVPTQFAALGASNAFQFQGTLPEDKEALAAALDKIIETAKEDDLREYRVNLRHL